MKLRIAMVFAAFTVFCGIFAVGCGGDDCTSAEDTKTAKKEECGVKTTAPSNPSGITTQCTAKAGAAALCQASCFEQADCSLIKTDAATPPTAEQANAYNACTAKCPLPN